MNRNIKKKYILNVIGVILLYTMLMALTSSGIVNRYVQGIIIFICINIVLATSLNLATGFLGQLALGHAGFMAIGAYGAALFSINYDFGMPKTIELILALLVGGALSGIVGIIIGLPALRLRGDYLGIITLGFGEMIRIIINNIKSITGGAQGLAGIQRLSNVSNAFWITVFVVVVIYTLTHSRQGRAIISIREDEIAAEAVGIKTTKFKLLGFAISAFFAGVGGGLFAHYIAFLDPNTFGFMKSVEILVIVVLGGMGSLTGSIISAILLTSLPELLRQFADYRLLVYSFLLIVMMIYRPQGLFGTKEISLVSIFSKFKERRTPSDDVEGSDL